MLIHVHAQCLSSAAHAHKLTQLHINVVLLHHISVLTKTYMPCKYSS